MQNVFKKSFILNPVSASGTNTTQNSAGSYKYCIGPTGTGTVNVPTYSRQLLRNTHIVSCSIP